MVRVCGRGADRDRKIKSHRESQRQRSRERIGKESRVGRIAGEMVHLVILFTRLEAKLYETFLL